MQISFKATWPEAAGAVRPLAGGGIAQRIVLTGETDVALPPFANFVGHGRRGLPHEGHSLRLE
ncbi:hypothetical protein ABIG06_001728 [Bradyrhizobium sp. USDA 326]